MNRRVSIGLCAAGTTGIAAAYASAFVAGGPGWGSWCMVAGLALLCTGCMALGSWRAGRRSPLFLASLALTALAIVAGFGLALALPATERPGTALVLGFPVRAASVLFLVGVLPLFVLPLVYAVTFEQLTLTNEDLDRVRAARGESPS